MCVLLRQHLYERSFYLSVHLVKRELRSGLIQPLLLKGSCGDHSTLESLVGNLGAALGADAW